MDLGLTGKRAVVAAASKGLGVAIANALAAEGCRLAICSRDEQRVADAAERIRSEHSAEVHAAVMDVTDGGEFRRWIDDAASRWAVST
jgi:3-oxoacyl-[acyl-carrier protein] reductase